MNEYTSAIPPPRGRGMLAALGVFASVLCCVAVLIVNHFEAALGRQLLHDLAMSQIRQLGDVLDVRKGELSLEQGLSHVLRDLSESTRDHFVAERIVDARGVIAGPVVLPAFGGIEDQFSDCRGAQDEAWGVSCRDESTADGAHYFLVRQSLGVGGWVFEGIFRASPAAVRELDSIYLTVVGVVVATLLASVLLMYPLVRFLQFNLLRTNRRLLQADLEMLKALGCAIAKRDSDTEDHNFRVTLYAVRIAEKMGLDTLRLRRLIKGALLHDIGKIAVRDAILLKPGRLDEKETVEMRKHVAYGMEIIAASGWLADAGEIVEGHHEKFDGTGYPHGLSGTDIPLLARVFAVADVFDALVSRRPYKASMPVDRAVAILKAERGRHFDPEVLDAFFALLAERGATFFLVDGPVAERAVERSIVKYFAVSPMPPARRLSWTSRLSGGVRLPVRAEDSSRP